MARFKEVELVDGRTVRVYRPPHTRITANIRKRLPEPQAPTITATGVTGKKIEGPPIANDPAYVAEHAAWEIRYSEEVDKMGSLFIFKDEEVPKDWSLEAIAGEEMRYFDPEWEPREGTIGRKLDYIQWDLLDDIVNQSRVSVAIRELSGVDSEEVAANLESFRDKVEGETD